MRKEVVEIIEEIRELSLNPKKYKDKIKKQFTLPITLIEIFKKHKFKYKLYQDSNNPEIRLIANLGEFKESSFYIKYSYFMHFSKFNKCYKDYYQFEIINRDTDKIESILTGIEYDAFTLKQQEFYNELQKALEIENFIMLSPRDCEYVLFDFKFSNADMKFFNEQPNVDLLVFNDFYDIIE